MIIVTKVRLLAKGRGREGGNDPFPMKTIPFEPLNRVLSLSFAC
jgi:hypothetical protein